MFFVIPCCTFPCVYLMPFVRRLILKRENNWNGPTTFRLVCLLWSIPPSYCRLRGRRMTKNRFIIIIFLVYQFRIAGRQPISIVSALLVLNSVAVPLEQSGFGRKHVTWPAIDRSCCIDQSLMQWYLNYSSARPHSYAFPSPPGVQRWYCCRSTAFFLYVSLMCFGSRLTQFCPKIWTSNLCLFLFMWCHICSSTLWSPDIAQISGHMFSATIRSLMVVAFIFAAWDIQKAHIFAPKHTLCSVFPLPTSFHSAHVPMLTFFIHF